MVLAETLLEQTSACILHSPILACSSHSPCLSTRATLHFAYTQCYLRFCNSNLINLRDLTWLLSTSEEETMSRMEVSTGVWERRWSDSESLGFPQWECLTHSDVWERSSPVSNSWRALWTSYNSVSMCCPLLVHCFFINTTSFEDFSEKENLGPR